MKLKLKVCGQKYFSNVLAVSELKPDYLGFIFYPESPRYMGAMIDPKHLRLIPDTIKKVGVFVNASVDEIHVTAKKYQLDAIQLHGDETVAFCAEIQKLGYPVWKAFRIGNSFDFETIKIYEPYVSLFVFDSAGNRFGGHGVSFDWEKLNNYYGNIPFFLSGGISPENRAVASKIKHPKMVGLDVNSKFEIIPGLKSISLLTELIQENRNS